MCREQKWPQLFYWILLFKVYYHLLSLLFNHSLCYLILIYYLTFYSIKKNPEENLTEGQIINDTRHQVGFQHNHWRWYFHGWAIPLAHVPGWWHVPVSTVNWHIIFFQTDIGRKPITHVRTLPWLIRHIDYNMEFLWLTS